jgi:hypothetical protein
MVDKTPEKIILSGVSKNKFFVNCAHVQHHLKIQKNMEKHYPLTKKRTMEIMVYRI